MRYRVALLAASSALLFTLPAFAQGPLRTGSYIQVDVGPDFYDTDIKGLTDNFDTGWGADAKLGAHLTRLIRGELEIGYEHADVGERFLSGDVSSWNFMLNGIVDLPSTGRIVPHIGAGLGTARVEADIAGPLFTPAFSYDDADWVFAWQLMGGFDWHLAPATVVDVDYRYLNADSATLGGFKTDHNSNLLRIGLRFGY